MRTQLGYTIGGCWVMFTAACLAAPSTVQKLRRWWQR